MELWRKQHGAGSKILAMVSEAVRNNSQSPREDDDDDDDGRYEEITERLYVSVFEHGRRSAGF